jgi:iron complex outermembrane receptor protein
MLSSVTDPHRRTSAAPQFRKPALLCAATLTLLAASPAGPACAQATLSGDLPPGLDAATPPPSGLAPKSRAARHAAPAPSEGDAASIDLAAITVAGRRQRGTDPVEGVAARVTATGTKTDTPLIEVPQAISVVPRTQLDRQGARSVGDSLRFTPGIFADTRVGGVLESVFLRGFGASATNPQVLDGLPLAKGGDGRPRSSILTRSNGSRFRAGPLPCSTARRARAASSLWSASARPARPSAR